MQRNLKLRLLTVVAVGAAAAFSAVPGSASESQARAPLRIGLILSQAPALAQFGRDAGDAWTYAAQEANSQGGVDGRRVIITYAGSDNTPTTTLNVAQRLTQQQGIRFLSAIGTSPENAAVSPQLAGWNAVNINPLGTDDGFTGSQCVRNAFRVVPNVSMEIRALASVLRKLPARRWAIQAADYSTGHRNADALEQALRSIGRDLVLEQYAPLGTTDFGSYITKILGSGADGLFIFEPGGDGVAFVNQGTQFGLFSRMRTVLAHSSTIPEIAWPAIGLKAVGFYASTSYARTVDTPLNEKFRRGFFKMFRKPPYFVIANNYLAAQILFEAVRRAKSVDPARVVRELERGRFDTIYGRVWFGRDHQLVRPTYVAQLVKTKKAVDWKIIHTATGKSIYPGPDPACQMG
ncbi:MAG: ABC transporter substrate-binding protein [Thermomicrobium sp.]|nr:ABC transporter substrate-binding protein [Thermomicrobium sp.]